MAVVLIISTHAPRTGSDSKNAQVFLCIFVKYTSICYFLFLLNHITKHLATDFYKYLCKTRREPPGGFLFTWTSRLNDQGPLRLVCFLTAKVLHLLLILVTQIVKPKAVLLLVHD